jgi:DNA-directed RNA polymerase specialized sigma24 family protein
VVAVNSYIVHAKRWARGWELHIDGVGVTQSHSLADADSMARSYIAMMTGTASNSFAVKVFSEVGSGLDEAALRAREAVREAEDALRGAAQQLRNVARDLSKHGLSGRDIARVLEVSPQRVSQLLGAAKKVVRRAMTGTREGIR